MKNKLYLQPNLIFTSMKVTVFFRINVSTFYNTDIMDYDYDLSEKEFQLYLNEKNHHKNDYDQLKQEYSDDFDDEELDDIVEEELKADDIDCSEYIHDIVALNYKILKLTLPEWCEQTEQYIIDEINNYCEEGEEDRACKETLAIEGCIIGPDDEDF